MPIAKPATRAVTIAAMTINVQSTPRSILYKKDFIAFFAIWCSCSHRTRSAPSFICWASAVDLSKRDWKSAPPCSQAILMADRILLAKTMNFDGLRLSKLRKLSKEQCPRGASTRRSKCEVTKMEELITIQQVADYLKVDRFTVYRLVTQKRIPAFKVGGQWRFKQEMIDSWLMRNSNMSEERPPSP